MVRFAACVVPFRFRPEEEGSGMVDPVIIEGEWRPQNRYVSHFKLFVQDECLIDYEVGFLFRDGRAAIKGTEHRMIYRYVRNTLVCDSSGEKLGSACLNFFGWHLDVPNRLRLQVNPYRVWDEKSGVSEILYEVSHGRFPLQSVKFRALDGPDFLVISVLAFETIRRITYVDAPQD
jgi:hypothetical protein